jgi:hypothetical protein
MYYFGYGANRSKERIKAIIEKNPLGGYSVVLNGYLLCIQSLKNIPEPPRKRLESHWGPSFRSYTLRKHPGMVTGYVWEFDDLEMEKIKHWEHIGTWKELINVDVCTSNGKIIHAVTESVYEKFHIEQISDGINYITFLNAQKNPVVKDEGSNDEIEKIRKYLADIKSDFST